MRRKLFTLCWAVSLLLSAYIGGCARCAAGPQVAAPSPRVVLMGVSAPAQIVTYLCDAGSMIGTFAMLKQELLRSVDGLAATQRFNVVFLARGGHAVALADAPVAATAGNKAKAAALLDETTTGMTDPIPALPVAFAGSPDLLYFVTDGDCPDNQAVLDAFRRQNAAKATTVHTIAFVGDGDDVSAAFLAFMGLLAGENGGTFTVVRESDLP
jgi:hypothetical protein